MRDPALGGTINPVRAPHETLPALPRPRVPGWVWLFAAAHALAAAYRVRRLAHTAAVLWNIRHSANAAATAVRGFASTRMLLVAMLIALDCTGVAKIVRRSYDARRFWLIAPPVMFVLSAVVAGMNASERRVLSATLGHPVGSDLSIPLTIWGCFASFLWWLYWKRSRRVREAFEPPAWPNGARDAEPVEASAATGV